MRLYSVHLRRHGLDADRDVVLVKEGFSWPGFLFTVLWALWHRLWWAAAVIVLAQAGLGALAWAVAPDPLSQAALSVGLGCVVGFVGNDVRRHRLERRGFELAGVAQGDDADAALARFLDGQPRLAEDLLA